MSTGPEAVPALLTARLGDRTLKPLSTGEFWALLALVGGPERLVDADAGAIGAITGYPEGRCARIEGLLARGLQLQEEQERLGSMGIALLSCAGYAYPARLASRLADGAPPILYAAGNLELLDEDGLGVVGSRNVAREAMQVAEEAGRAAAEHGISVVSGAARGIDQIAMGAALEAQGSVVGLPADSMERMLTKPEVAGPVEEGRLCLATPLSPSAGFSVGAAMGRNKLIYALSRATLVVTSDEGTGGTWAGATEALKKKISAVAVWEGPGAGPGNAKLVRMGAVPVSEARQVLRAPRREGGKDEGDEQLRMIF